MKVFISHAAADREIAERIAAVLGRDGMEVFTYWHDVAAGEAIRARVFEAINSSDAVIVLVSSSSERSIAVSEETSVALYSDRHLPVKVIPVIVEAGIQVPVMLRDIRGVDLSSPDRWQRGIDDLLAALHIPSRESYRDEWDYIRASRDALEVEKLEYEFARRKHGLEAIVGVMSRATTAGGLLVAGVAIWLSSELSLVAFSRAAPDIVKIFLTLLGPVAAFAFGYYFGTRSKADRP